MSLKKYLFIDRDGTIIEEPSDFQIDTVEKFKLLPGVIPSLIALQKAGYRLIMVSNQDGLGTERYPQKSFDQVQTLLMGILESQGIEFESVRICPHFEAERCACRKPQTGLIRDMIFIPELDRSRSYVIGDRNTDLLLAENIGVQGILINSLGWKELTHRILSQPRTGSCVRKTKETQIRVSVDLDSIGATSISTGIGFFDHMLEQLSHHAGISTTIVAQGDLHIDEHHTVEDTAIALGTAFRQALSDKAGIGRYGFFLPMDEASTQVALDLSGRSYFVFKGDFLESKRQDRVGGIALEMFPHFFRSFSDSLGASLHLEIRGENTHHQIESAFKAVGRCLRSAIQLEPRGTGQIPSTKGLL